MLHRRVPVLAARVAGAEEVMPEEVSFEVGDVEGMRERIREALAHPEGLRSIMLPVFELAATRLTVARCCEETVAVYRSVLAQ
jgi:glycosyltransferase involved in cell wall biosynthesis